ncbi:inactivated superfamily I helicase [Candidatus Endolissoclinum faulkneri L5]|uniref:Inactivated superfamily I helicase n=1 Tax=Candidatus Endolissoclinum faulkneri L5 TaxID=1401328 RepID=V9TXA4_9PROT|nr:double-strand break repair protein AddB [Candidatus Endolissoclinum faulkneri]AHC73960.1 inactivated superfamily I helicase [Candidatus Endolissoclinum faulkneri L5]
MTGGLYSIPITAPFLDCLVAGIWERVNGNLIELTDVQVVLPSRIAVRATAKAFLRLVPTPAVLLPKLSTIADEQEYLSNCEVIPKSDEVYALEILPAVPNLQRNLELMRLIIGFFDTYVSSDVSHTPEQAYLLATKLANLIDEIQTHELCFASLKDLVPNLYAGSWDKTLALLTVVVEGWYTRLKALSAIDPMVRRGALIRAKAAHLLAKKPRSLVILAGFTDLIPATAELMKAVLTLPNGAIVLPGLDIYSDQLTWSAIANDPSHPQHGMNKLINALGITRANVQYWTSSLSITGRDRLIHEIMRPAVTTDVWCSLFTAVAAPKPVDFEKIIKIDVSSSREEAEIIALLMREVLEQPDKNAALVTNDRDLARRVSNELDRWQINQEDNEKIAIKDCGGFLLSNSVPAIFMRLVVRAAIDCAPVALLSLLKHQLSNCGLTPERLEWIVRLIDREVLRGPRPPAGLAGLLKAIEAIIPSRTINQAAADLLLYFCQWLAKALGPLEIALSRPAILLIDIMNVHLRTAEMFATSHDAHGSLRLWAGEDGAVIAQLFREFIAAAANVYPIAGKDWPGLFNALLEKRVVKHYYNMNARLHILGLPEARLQTFDRLILGGLNEGNCPSKPESDPWISRLMRRNFGLPDLNLSIGKTAHDIAMAMGSQEIFLTRSQRNSGNPTIPSRWLLRLDTVARVLNSEEKLTFWQKLPSYGYNLLDMPKVFDPGRRPEPRPRLSQRPRRLPITQINTWLRDPYSIYARYILNLRKLDPLDMKLGAAEYGKAIHAALGDFVRDYPRTLPPQANKILIAYGKRSFAAYANRLSVWAFWWPCFKRVASWFVKVERERRKSLNYSAIELKGTIAVPAPGGLFELFGTADRIDKRKDGSYSIVDYKSGLNPTLSDLKTGWASQLPLEAMILLAGGFSDILAADISSLEYWRVGLGNQSGKIDLVDKIVPSLISEARSGLESLIATFDEEKTPYCPAPHSHYNLRFRDYEHLARVGDW